MKSKNTTKTKRKCSCSNKKVKGGSNDPPPATDITPIETKPVIEAKPEVRPSTGDFQENIPITDEKPKKPIKPIKPKKPKKPVEPVEPVPVMQLPLENEPKPAPKKETVALDFKTKYAIIASSTYSSEVYPEIYNYTIDKSLSTKTRRVYMNDSEIVLAIKGTNPANLKDLWDDVAVFFDTLHRTKTFTDLNSFFRNRVLPKAKGKAVIITGHSLGASLAIELLRENINSVDAVYAYNTGMGVKRFAKETIIGALCKIMKKTKGCKLAKDMRGKIKSFTTTLDPLSILSVSIGAEVDNPTRLNVHSALNFVNFVKEEDVKGSKKPKEPVQVVEKPMSRGIAKPDRKFLIDLIKQYAPITYLHSGERFNMCNMEFLYPHHKIEKRGGDIYMSLTNPVSNKQPAKVHPWGYGQSNATAPVYIFIQDLANGNHKIHFYHFFAYNYGKKIPVLGNKAYGNHYFDAEHSFLIFDQDWQPINIGWKHHSNTETRDYNTTEVKREGDHGIFYMANGSHATYPFSGNHTYKNVAGLIKLVDKMNKGYRKNSWDKFIVVEQDAIDGKKNVGFDENENDVSLNTPYDNVSNWVNQITFVGQGSRGKLNLSKYKLGKNQYQLSAHVRMPPSLMKSK